MRVLITGCDGLVGSECAFLFNAIGYEVIGIDNDMRAKLFGTEASTSEDNKIDIKKHTIDIREDLSFLFEKYKFDIIVHTAAQPSHDLSSKYPRTDFSINALGTLNLLENCRLHTPEAVFVYISTNKVYGDNPNKLTFEESSKRYSAIVNMEKGVDESMSVDKCMHSLFGVSKLSGDLLTQEYGRYFGIKTGVFRCGCITGDNHKGVELHGFLSYLVKCAVKGKKYTIYGYKGKQVRDNIYGYDLATAIYTFVKKPKIAAIYNMGGGMKNNISILEAIELIQDIIGKKINHVYLDKPRKGDHKWYISNIAKFKKDFPEWKQTYSIKNMIERICEHENLHTA